jgi:uncharacterized protein (UPF0332 family)
MITPTIMNWNTCERDFIYRVEPDPQRAKSIVMKAHQRLRRAQQTSLTEETVSFMVEDYYEVIKELLVAYLLQKGLRSKNHQCLISYFARHHPDLEQEAILIAQMSYFRNRLDYYGESVPVGFYEKHKEEFKRIITVLGKLL